MDSVSNDFTPQGARKSTPPYDGRPLQILALDGGGYRGLFTAQVLADWEARLGRPIADCFDMFVGTSTGGIIALALAAGVAPRELVKFYEEDGKKVFPKRWTPRKWTAGARHWIWSKYNAARIEEALKKRLPDLTMGDLTKPVVVPAFNLESGRHWFFKTRHIEENLLDAKRPIWQVARATSAAPTFFPAYRSPQGELFIDGGVLANNPSLIGYFEAQIFFRDWRDNLKILNIGTDGGEGSLNNCLLERGGLFAWAKSIPDVLLQAQAVSTESLLGKLLGPERWLRVQPENGRCFAPLDIYNPALYKGLASQQAARFYADADSKFFQHRARTNLF